MKIDIYYTQPQYRRHLMPIYRALPDDIRGDIISDAGRPKQGNLVLVAGGIDAEILRDSIVKVIYVEHGAGQSYGGDRTNIAAMQTPGYSLADGHRWPYVKGFICPNERVAANWTSAPSVAVGCPKMDEYITQDWQPSKSVCFVWHWDARFIEEARSAWDHYSLSLQTARLNFQRQGYRVFGHAHPRWKGYLDAKMNNAGLQVIESDEDVFLNAEIMILDNSSMGPEHASLGRPIVWLNAPWYRRNVQHGGRFWVWEKMAPAMNDRFELAGLQLDSIIRPKGIHPVAAHAYSHVDGKASQRAADWVMERLDSGDL